MTRKAQGEIASGGVSAREARGCNRFNSQLLLGGPIGDRSVLASAVRWRYCGSVVKGEIQRAMGASAERCSRKWNLTPGRARIACRGGRPAERPKG